VIKLPDKEISERLLINELKQLAIPGFTGIARLSREIDDEGRAVLGSNGKPIIVPRYILIKYGPLTPEQGTLVRQTVEDHVSDYAMEKTELLRRFQEEAGRRSAVHVPEWNNFNALKTGAGTFRSPEVRRGATPSQITAQDIYQYAIDAESKIATLATRQRIEAVNPEANDPFNDGEVWPG